MVQFVFFMVLIAFASAKNLSNLGAEIKVVEDIDTFKAQNPHLNLVPLTKEATGRAEFRYYAGNRQVGDRLVAQGADGASYATAQNVEVTISYPTSGTGAVVTYAEVLVNQSSNLGNAYVSAGGPGQRFIQIVVQAKSTFYVNWSAVIYGK